MVDILELTFKQFCTQQTLDDRNIFSIQECNTLVLGQGSINRSLLFHVAITAAQTGLKVIFFTKTPIQSLPVPFRGSVHKLNPDSLKKIRFVYSRSLDNLLQDIASLHELTREAAIPPSLIILDGLESYLCDVGERGSGMQREDQRTAAHIVALLHDSVAFLSWNLESRTQNQAPCRVIVSFSTKWEGSTRAEVSSPDPILAVLDRYFQVRCTLEQERSPTSGGNTEQEEWSVYLSGSGGSKASVRQWRLVMQLGGAMEFSPVNCLLEATPFEEVTGEV